MVSEVLSDPAEIEITKTNNWQWWQVKRLAEQGPELLKRVSGAGQIYQQLREIHRRERALRAEVR